MVWCSRPVKDGGLWWEIKWERKCQAFFFFFSNSPWKFRTAITVRNPVAPIGPCSLIHLPCYISFWISHGGSLKNRASEERKRGIDDDRWGRGAASVRQRCPFTQQKKEHHFAQYLSSFIINWDFPRSLQDVFANSRTADSHRWWTLSLNRSLVCSLSSPLRSLCN